MSRSNSLSSTDMAAFIPHQLQDPNMFLPSGGTVQQTANSMVHSRHSSASTTYSTTALTSPADSPPQSGNQTGLKSLPSRMSHIRARAATSPYPRDHSDSVHSSSSETDEIAMFLSSQAQQDFHQHHHHHQAQPMYASPAHLSHDQFGRIQQVHHQQQHLRLDHGLEQLAANVRSATTTSASDRAKQIFVQAWLNANYATYPDGNVPRQGLYMSYRRVCDQYNIPHINTATLGKAIRLCFPTIKTRRLGVRGNSKYHYCGIRPSTQQEAEWLQDYVRKSNNNKNQSDAARASGKSGDEGGSDAEDDDESSEGGGPGPASVSKRNSLTIHNAKGIAIDPSDKTPTAKSILASATQPPRPAATGAFANTRIRRSVGPETGLGPTPHPTVPTAAPPAYLSHRNVSVRNLPNFPSIDEAVGASSTTPHGLAAREVWGWFETHLDQLLDSVRTHRFDQFEIHIRTFWQNLTGEYREVVHAPAIAGLMAKADAILYDEVLETLRSQMLQPIPPQSLTSLRQLADKMEKILMFALKNYGNTFVEPKVELGARFGHLVLRCLDIFQVTQALHTVLTNPKQVQDMRRSWSMIDFDSVRNQSALVCNCRQEELAQLLEVDFISMLDSVGASPEPVRDVMAWADDICDKLVASRAAMSSTEEKSTLSSRSVLIRWGYVTSQIMRDLTIRSDPTFGAFQILKLFLDDWIALNVLRSVALSTNSVAQSVEPPMPQQFFQMSPMASNDFGSGMNGTRGDMMNPTSSSMLAALNADFPTSSLDATNGFGSSFGNTLPYMDGGSGGLPFQDFVQPSSNPFDFNQDLSLGSSRGVLDGDRELTDEPVPQDSVL